MNKIYIYIILLIVGVLFTFFGLTQTRLAQRELGNIQSGLNINRYQQLCALYSNYSDKKLIDLLHHGDTTIQNAARTVLGKRNKSTLFESYSQLLDSRQEETRMNGRVLLTLDMVRATPILLAELKKKDISDTEYQQVLMLLIKIKASEVFLPLYEYTKNDLNNQHGSSELMKSYDDPRGIEALQEMLKNSPNISKYEKIRVNEAIDYLRSNHPINPKVHKPKPDDVPKGEVIDRTMSQTKSGRGSD